MAKGKRSTPEINSSSTADMAFLLLIFFLITTSMDTDRGLARRLPPPVPKDQKNDADKRDGKSEQCKEKHLSFTQIRDYIPRHAVILDVFSG